MAFFKIIGADKKTKARVGILKTSHGKIQTPVFLPVGTQGTVKSLTPEDLSKIGVQMFLANTYHLYLRPGVEVIEKLGGLHKFIGWKKPLMTDSGGFQIFSLNRGKTLNKTLKNAEEIISDNQRFDQRQSALLVKIDDNGVTLRSHLDGSLHRFTPETSIEVQKKLGADIILAFDECPPYGVERKVVKKATERTHQWALRCLAAVGDGSCRLAAPSVPHSPNKAGAPAWGAPLGVTRRQKKQALFGIIQGGVYRDLREESAKFISSLPFEGVAIGGVAVGESKEEMRQVLDWVMPYLSREKPRHLLGVGEIDDIFEAVERGIDMFDCVMPTRLGRMGHVLVKSQKLKVKNSTLRLRSGQEFKMMEQNSKFRFDITKAVFASDPRPLVEGCECDTCQNFSRAYLNHLFRSRELLAYRLATYHNLWFMEDLMRQIREAIIKGQFRELKKEWLGH